MNRAKDQEDGLLDDLHRKRQRQEQRLQLIATIPAKDLAFFLDQENEAAATKIQAAWRGYSFRRSFVECKMQLKKEKAAKIIQKMWRKQLNLKSLEKIENEFHSKINFNSDDVSEFQHEIEDWSNSHKLNLMNSQQLKKLEDEVQDLLTLYYREFHKDKAQKHIQHNLILQLDNDIQTLSNLPSLSEVTFADACKFSTRNKGCQKNGKEHHLKALKELDQPWRKILSSDRF